MEGFKACGMMGDPNIPLCAGLARFKEEHVSLREKMDAFQQLTLAVGGDARDDITAQLKVVEAKVTAFEAELLPHSEREEVTLFPVMARYIGREMGPVAVMEYEHEQGKMKLQDFHNAMRGAGGIVTLEQVKKILQPALEAHQILQDHFFKEENVLFPMAERMLSEEEKATL